MYVAIGRIPVTSGQCEGVEQGEQCSTMIPCRCLNLNLPVVMSEVKALIRAYCQIPMTNSTMWTLTDERNYAGWVDENYSSWAGPTEEDLAQMTGSQWVFPTSGAIEMMLRGEQCLTFVGGAWAGCPTYPFVSNFYAETKNMPNRGISLATPIIGGDPGSREIPPTGTTLPSPPSPSEPYEIETVVITASPPTRQAGVGSAILVGSIVAGIGVLAALTLR